MNSRLFQHMAETHNLHLTESEEHDIMSAALDNYDSERIKQGQRIGLLESEAQGDRARCELAEEEADKLREALIRLVQMTQSLGELHDEAQEDTEDVDHILSNGDCRRIAEAVGNARVTLEDCLPDAAREAFKDESELKYLRARDTALDEYVYELTGNEGDEDSLTVLKQYIAAIHGEDGEPLRKAATHAYRVLDNAMQILLGAGRISIYNAQVVDNLHQALNGLRRALHQNS